MADADLPPVTTALVAPHGGLDQRWFFPLKGLFASVKSLSAAFSNQIGGATLGTAAVENVGAAGHTLPFLDAANTWSKAQTFDPVQLTDAASIAWDWSLGPIAKVTLGGNRTLAAPTNLGTKAGTWSLFVRQDGTGSRTLAYNSAFLFPLGVDPVLSTNANALDVLTFVYDGTSIVGAISKRFL